MTQLDLFPDEEPVTASRRTRPASLSSKARRILREDGLYNYAQLVIAAQQYRQEYVTAKFGITKEELCNTLVQVFDHAVGYQESLEDFLANVKNIPGYGLPQVE